MKLTDHVRRTLTVVLLVLTMVGCSGPQQPVPATTTTPAKATATQALPTPTMTTSATAPPTSTPTSLPPTLTPTEIPSPATTPSPTPAPKAAGQTVDLPDVDAHYTLEITSLNLDTGSVNVTETVDITSHQGAIPELYFSVATAKWGYFRFGSATVDGNAVTPASLNDGFTLGLTPPAADRWTVGFAYQLQLAQVPHDWYGSGLDGDIVRLGYWFPLLSTDFPYPSTADPAYSRIATFDVSLPLPNDVPIRIDGSGGQEREDRCWKHAPRSSRRQRT